MDLFTLASEHLKKSISYSYRVIECLFIDGQYIKSVCMMCLTGGFDYSLFRTRNSSFEMNAGGCSGNFICIRNTTGTAKTLDSFVYH